MTDSWPPIWRPIRELDRTKDDTYMVRVETTGGGIGPGWIDKAWFCDDGGVWYDDAMEPLERGPWKVTAFAAWPDLADVPATRTDEVSA